MFVVPMSSRMSFIADIPHLEPKGIVASSFKRAWIEGYSGRGIIVGILDTGIDAGHPEIRGKVVKSLNYTVDNSPGIHGTHICGTIAAHGRLVGGAHNASIIDFKVVSEAVGYGSPDVVAEAIMKGADEGCSVLNLSLAATELSYQAKTKLSSAVSYAWNRGCVCISASGNYGNLDLTTMYAFPASIDLVQAVSSCFVDENHIPMIDDYSSENKRVMVSCVGTDVLSTVPNGYAMLTGTSMASAHASAMAAIYAEKLVRAGMNPHSPSFSRLLVDELHGNTIPIYNREAHGYGFVRYRPSTPVLSSNKYYIDETYVGDLIY
jgi:subtilisin family serine protease